MTFTRNRLDSGRPYAVWKAPVLRWWCVIDRAGNNVLRACDGSGRVFTDEGTAKELAEKWNG